MKVRPYENRILVRPEEPEGKSSGGIVLPDSARDSDVLTATVLAIGPGRKTDDGTIIEVNIPVDSRVLYTQHVAMEVTIDGEKLAVLRDNDVLAILED